MVNAELIESLASKNLMSVEVSYLSSTSNPAVTLQYLKKKYVSTVFPNQEWCYQEVVYRKLCLQGDMQYMKIK